jgi:hypothetical protein
MTVCKPSVHCVRFESPESQVQPRACVYDWNTVLEVRLSATVNHGVGDEHLCVQIKTISSCKSTQTSRKTFLCTFSAILEIRVARNMFEVVTWKRQAHIIMARGVTDVVIKRNQFVR